MKKRNIFAAILSIFIAITINTIGIYAIEADFSVSNGVACVSGAIDAGDNKNRDITLLALYPGYRPEDVSDTNYLNTVAYQKQITADSDGKFNACFSLENKPQGSYPITLYSAAENKAVSGTIDNLADISNTADISIDESNIRIDGQTRFKRNNKNLSLLVLYPDKTQNDILTHGYKNTVAYQKQLTADSDGKFNAEFSLKDKPQGNYSIFLYSAAEKMMYKGTIDYSADINIELNLADAFGNNFFDYTNIQFSYKLKTKVFDVEKGDISLTANVYRPETGELVYQKCLDENQSKIDLSDAAVQYGVFELELCATDTEYSMTKSSNRVKFSVINAPKNNMRNSRMGAQFHYATVGRGAQYLENVTELFARAGYGNYRDEVAWNSYEREPGEFVLGNTAKRLIKSGSENSFESMYILAYSNEKLTDESPPHSTEALKAFGNYVYHLVGELKGKVNNFEVWNEYNWYPFNKDKTKPTDYVNMLKAAYTKAHEANENVRVHGGGFAFVTEPEYNIYTWTEEVFKNGGGKYMDTFSMHIYTQSTKPEYADKAGKIAKIRTILDKYGYKNMPIVISETGYSSTEGIGFNSGYSGTNYEICQAQYELRDLALLYDSVDKLYWYSAQNKQLTSEDSDNYEYENNLGHINDWENSEYPCLAKPVFVAMSNFNAIIGNGQLTAKKVDGTRYDYLFKAQGDDDVHMLWNIGGTSEYILGIEGTTVEIYDMFSNKKLMNTANGAITLELSEMPIYVKKSKDFAHLLSDSGNEIYKPNGEKMRMEIDCSAVTDETSGVFVVGMYDGDVLSNCIIQPFDKNKSQNAVINIPKTKADRIKLFAFKDMVFIRPLNISSEWK